MPIVGDVDGGALIVAEDDGAQTGVVWGLMRDDVNGRLTTSLGQRVGFVPYRWTLCRPQSIVSLSGRNTDPPMPSSVPFYYGLQHGNTQEGSHLSHYYIIL